MSKIYREINMIIKLKDRNSYILKVLIKEYTRTGEPVSSEILNAKYRLGVSSATIRNDFVVLTEEGYLYKPYISSGRIPTDKAWKFFIDTISEENDSSEQWEELSLIHISEPTRRTPISYA